MTRAEHLDQWRQHTEQSDKLLAKYIESHKLEDFKEYRTELKLANKHHGIASAMFTKELKKYI